VEIERSLRDPAPRLVLPLRPLLEPIFSVNGFVH
jgi:hypothetical protein